MKPGQTFIYCYSSQDVCLLKVLHKLTELKEQLCSSRGSSWEVVDLSHHTCQATKPFLLFCGKGRNKTKRNTEQMGETNSKCSGAALLTGKKYAVDRTAAAAGENLFSNTLPKWQSTASSPHSSLVDNTNLMMQWPIHLQRGVFCFFIF